MNLAVFAAILAVNITRARCIFVSLAWYSFLLFYLAISNNLFGISRLAVTIRISFCIKIVLSTPTSKRNINKILKKAGRRKGKFGKGKLEFVSPVNMLWMSCMLWHPSDLFYLSRSTAHTCSGLYSNYYLKTIHIMHSEAPPWPWGLLCIYERPCLMLHLQNFAASIQQSIVRETISLPSWRSTIQLIISWSFNITGGQLDVSTAPNT